MLADLVHPECANPKKERSCVHKLERKIEGTTCHQVTIARASTC